MSSVAADFPNSQIPDAAEASDPARGQVAAIVATQNDCLCMLSEVGQWWLDRMAEEAGAAQALTNGLVAARSIPEVMAAYQHWMTRHGGMLAADSRELLALAENFAELGSHFARPDGTRERT